MRMMPTYRVVCGRSDCTGDALFKIAAEWSDGTTRELKTYFLACPSCLKGLYSLAGVKQRACRLAPGETLDAPGIYDLARGVDRKLTRRPDLEL